MHVQGIAIDYFSCLNARLRNLRGGGIPLYKFQHPVTIKMVLISIHVSFNGICNDDYLAGYLIRKYVVSVLIHAITNRMPYFPHACTCYTCIKYICKWLKIFTMIVEL